jgi:sugar lactone lactonase YvrE
MGAAASAMAAASRVFGQETKRKESPRMNSTATLPDAFRGHDGGRWAPVASEVVVSWPRGHFAENLAVDSEGVVYVTLHSHNRIDRFDPRTQKVEEFARLTAPVAGLAFDAAGSLWVTGGVVGQAPGYIWRVRSGQPELWVEVSDAVFMNGCTPHLDGRTLLVCESATGRVLAVDQREKRWSVWLQDDRLRPKMAQTPGANGVKLRDRWAWISVTSHDRMVRAKIAANGAAGPVEGVAEELRADDFAFAESGAAYIATHPAQTVLRLHPDGKRETIAGPLEGAVGSTACAFGRRREDRQSLYVTTTGGLRYAYRGEVQDAKLLRLHVGERGRPLLLEQP